MEEEKKKDVPEESSEDSVKEAKKEEQAPAPTKEDDDEEITLDFSKVKNLFKGKEKKKEKHHHKEHEDKEDDEEINVDFSKITKVFKNALKDDKPKSQEHHEKKEHYERKESKDEINLDFSKVKNIFKSKEGKKEKDDDEDITIDLGKLKKLKNIFKSDAKDDDGDDINIDWKKAKNFFVKYCLFFVILIPLILAVDVRMQSSDWPITDNWARDSVFNNIKGQISNQINQQYPNLPSQNRDALVEAEFQKQLNANWPQIQQQIEATSNFFKQHFQRDNGVNYMPDIDTYYWYRYAQNILDHGHPGDELRDGAPWDNHQLAPFGRAVTKDMFPSYFIAYFHSFLRMFNPSIDLMQSMSLYPVFIAAISTVLVFLIALKITNQLGALFAAILFSVNSTFLGRTLYGHADSDAWVVFFSVLVTWLFFEIFSRKRLWTALLLATLAGIAVGLFSFSWIGWWYIFDFILIMVAASLTYLVIADFKEVRKDWLGFFKRNDVKLVVLGTVVFFFVSMITVSIFLDSSSFFNGLLGPLAFSTIKSPVYASLWPNVLTTVAELNEGSINHGINSVGGKFMFFISIMGVLLILTRKFGKKELLVILGSGLFYWWLVWKGTGIGDIPFVILLSIPWGVAILLTLREKGALLNVKYAILLILWFAASLYAVSKGVRFAMMLAPAFGVAFGASIGILYDFFNKWLSREFHIHKVITSIMLVLLFFIILVGPVKNSYGAAGSDLPIVNDVWWNSLTAIKQNSTMDNAIITSWWDFGHHFKSIADRPVTFDGTTQTAHAAHWVGNLFMIPDERKAIGILRLLDCGRGTAPKVLQEKTQDAVEMVGIMHELALLDKEKADELLTEKGFTQEERDGILSRTNCDPPEGYAIASGDMIGKSGVWAHFGSWDFVKADIWFNVRKMPEPEAVSYLMERHNYTQERAENVYFEVKNIRDDSEANRWVAPWPGYGGTTNCRRNSPDQELFGCDNGYQFNYTNKEVFGIQNGQTVRPSKISYVTKEGMAHKRMNGTTAGFGLTLIPENSNHFVGIISSPELTGGMFTRMFYSQGHGLRYFEPVRHDRGIIGTEVHVYKADWEGNHPYIHQPYVDILDQIENPPPKEQPAVEDEEELLQEEPLSDSNNLTS